MLYSQNVWVFVIVCFINRHILVPLRFYGRNSSYVHGGLDASGKLAEAVYGQAVSDLDQ